MLMALANRDGSFTVTLYLPTRGEDGLETLGADGVQNLFERQFPDAVPLIPDLRREFLAHPTGELGTVRCGPWNVGGSVALIGDAAHAIVPFFGQGMNSGFEDCTVLDALCDRHGSGNWAAILPEFSRTRKDAADAIADMAIDNFIEMSERVGDPAFLLRKAVEHRLEHELPSRYRSRYSMVMYSSIPYRRALEAGRIQKEILDELCRGIESADDADVDLARRLVRDRLTPYLQRHDIDLTY